MRKINLSHFQVARKKTTRDINRRIALNLIRTHQPISRADLARMMNLGRGVITLLINELIAAQLVYEGATGENSRGRKPTFLYVRTEDRLVLAVDVRFSKTYLMLTDFAGKQLALETFPTVLEPQTFVKDLAGRIRRLRETYDPENRCEGVGVAVPGIVNVENGCILLAPSLGWRDVPLRELLSETIDLKIYVENAPKACALAQLWLGHKTPENFVYVSISDGIGVGVVMHGELVRGRDNLTGEFGHIPLNLSGPECFCGRRGCWEAYSSNLATVAHYFDKELIELIAHSKNFPQSPSFSIDDVILRAGSGDEKALSALKKTAEFLGLGLSAVVLALNPEQILLSGELIAAWDLIADTVDKCLASRVITHNERKTLITIASTNGHPRLLGAAALVIAPTFAAVEIA